MECPACGASVPAGSVECGSCGVVVAKWRPRTFERPLPQRVVVTKAHPRFRLVTLLGVAGAALVVGAFWNFSIRPRMESLRRTKPGTVLGRAKTLEVKKAGIAGFDIAYELPGSPQGIASDGSEIVVANRVDPWGVIRLRRVDDERLLAQKIPIIEPEYHQKMSVNALTWNGSNYVGITTADWFRAQGDVFTIHDRNTLAITSWKPAPPLVGCVAWDGKGYWASTRRHTQEQDTPALLYRLDAAFNVVSTSEPPAVGCQGLAFDGERLWFADVFSDAIYVIDISGATPRVVHTANTELSYLSGLVAYNGEMWATDYDDNMLRRIAPSSRIAWTAGRSGIAAVAAGATMPAAPLDSGDIAQLQRQLRADHWSERMRAEMELERRGAPIDFDRDQNNFVDREKDDTEVIDWYVELHDGAIYGSWKIWFGPDVFVRRQATGIVSGPQFARYTVTVIPPDGQKIEKEYEVPVSGDHTMTGERLADATAPGEYRVELFIHVQYIAEGGALRILNRSTTSLRLRR